jgi:hypothetical protein
MLIKMQNCLVKYAWLLQAAVLSASKALIKLHTEVSAIKKECILEDQYAGDIFTWQLPSGQKQSKESIEQHWLQLWQPNLMVSRRIYNRRRYSSSTASNAFIDFQNVV